MKNIFNTVVGKKPRRNLFDLSHEKKLSFQIGQLVPIMVQDVLPGDIFRVQSNTFLRFAPMLAPIMHNVDLYIHYFFVPNRLVMKTWPEYIGGGEDGMSPDVLPFTTMKDIAAGFAGDLIQPSTLPDYMGLPTIMNDAFPAYDSTAINILPFKVYQLVYNEYYRDPNLSDPVDILIDQITHPDSPEVRELFVLRQRAWKKDYFTSALPWTQRGAEVTIPMAGDAPISGHVASDQVVFDYLTNGALNQPEMAPFQVTPPSGTFAGGTLLDDGDPSQASWSSRLANASVSGFADMTGVTTTTINDLRVAIRVQEWLEKNARGGSRYIEQMLVHFGVRTPDARLQRPEYLGGGIAPLMISEVLQSAPATSAADTPLGTFAGRGVSINNSSSFKYRSYEHGYIIGIASVIPKASYMQGIKKDYLRSSRFDFYWPTFAHLGEQAIENRELFYSGGDSAADKDVFGYTPRYAEYKYNLDSVHGEFRNSLDFWHMARKFTTRPTLSTDFIEVNEKRDDINRIFAVISPGVEHLYCQIYNQVRAVRPMPRFGTPTL